MARRGPTRKKRSQEQLKGMAWRMPSEEQCDEAIDAVARANTTTLSHQPFRGSLAPVEENGVYYTVYLIGHDEEPHHFQVQARAAIIRQAGGLLCTDETLVNRLKNKSYLEYRNRRPSGR